MKNAVFILALSVFLFTAPYAKAENYVRTFENLTRLNSKNLENNPEYQAGDDLLERHVLDRKNKVVGEIRDVILNPRGTVSALNVEFNRLNLREKVYLNVRDMGVSPVTNGYALSFDDDQIEELYPNLLANVETAAGEEGVISLTSLRDADIRAEDGRRLGQVKNVLFDARGSRAMALLVLMKYGGISGGNLAVPFTLPKYEQHNRTTSLTVSNEEADVMIEYVR